VGDKNDRRFEEVEIIDIKSEDELREKWDPFILSHHYRTCSSFYDSLTANHPRRTCDAMWRQVMDAESSTTIPCLVRLNGLSCASGLSLVWDNGRRQQKTTNPAKSVSGLT